MYLRLLGTAAGGGFPQWNCACLLCRRARSNWPRAATRLHASLAVSATGDDWHLVNATPDVGLQIESFPPLQPQKTAGPFLRQGELRQGLQKRDTAGPLSSAEGLRLARQRSKVHSASGLRQTPLRGILLTDAELDHTLGLLVLREGTPLDIYATPVVLECLADSFPVQEILRPYTSSRWREIRPREPFPLEGGRLRVRSIPLGLKKPRYAAHSKVQGDWVIGYRFEDAETKRAAVYAPAVEEWNPELRAALAGADCVLVDGTFWTDDEMIRAGVGERTARAMGHLPISGSGGSAAYLSALPTQRRIYIHVNNTNPILEEHSAERRYLAARGIEVGWDGMDLEV